uniref:C3H1-type domain-containing protein n=1 Tax=Prorocentrum micans TaxID=2945 RepID=A0A7S2X565_PROMC|mmetsp:Transcript_1846/g.1430  ORF Transcript_1846/g.1430 Transcript_1846/m.1430 type:complete len:104 (+) Transcript_1846:1-312(+)
MFVKEQGKYQASKVNITCLSEDNEDWKNKNKGGGKGDGKGKSSSGYNPYGSDGQWKPPWRQGGGGGGGGGGRFQGGARPICHAFRKHGFCRGGDTCSFSHDPE